MSKREPISNDTLTRCQHCGKLTNYADDDFHKARATTAERERAEFVELLRAARCPDSSNASHEAHPCPWCHQRDAILDKHKTEGRGK